MLQTQRHHLHLQHPTQGITNTSSASLMMVSCKQLLLLVQQLCCCSDNTLLHGWSNLAAFQSWMQDKRQNVGLVHLGSQQHTASQQLMRCSVLAGYQPAARCHHSYVACHILSRVCTAPYCCCCCCLTAAAPNTASKAQALLPSIGAAQHSTVMRDKSGQAFNCSMPGAAGDSGTGTALAAREGAAEVR